MTSYVKPHLSFDAQVQLLQSRGMVIDNPAAAAQLLSVIGYYRLSGYWYPWQLRVVDGAAWDAVGADTGAHVWASVGGDGSGGAGW